MSSFSDSINPRPSRSVSNLLDMDLEREEKLYSLALVPEGSPNARGNLQMYVYAQGVSPMLMPLGITKNFVIRAYRLEGADYKESRLTWAFLRFQQFYRWRHAFRKQALHYLRRRELSLAPPPLPSLRHLLKNRP